MDSELRFEQCPRLFLMDNPQQSNEGEFLGLAGSVKASEHPVKLGLMEMQVGLLARPTAGDGAHARMKAVSPGGNEEIEGFSGVLVDLSVAPTGNELPEGLLILEAEFGPSDRNFKPPDGDMIRGVSGSSPHEVDALPDEPPAFGTPAGLAMPAVIKGFESLDPEIAAATGASGGY